MDDGFEYVIDHPLMTEGEYPYMGKDGTCTAHDHGVGKINDYNDVKSGSASQLKAAISKGPVSIAIEADKMVFQLYKSGVLKDAGCGHKLDHGVLAVGYGTEGGEGYFLVKNSWGPDWGD